MPQYLQENNNGLTVTQHLQGLFPQGEKYEPGFKMNKRMAARYTQVLGGVTSEEAQAEHKAGLVPAPTVRSSRGVSRRGNGAESLHLMIETALFHSLK